MDDQDRDVLYRVGVASHPETSAVLDELGREVVAAQERIQHSMAAVAENAIQQIRRLRAETTAPTGFVPAPVAMPAGRSVDVSPTVMTAVAPTATEARQQIGNQLFGHGSADAMMDASRRAIDEVRESVRAMREVEVSLLAAVKELQAGVTALRGGGAGPGPTMPPGPVTPATVRVPGHREADRAARQSRAQQTLVQRRQQAQAIQAAQRSQATERQLKSYRRMERVYSQRSKAMFRGAFRGGVQVARGLGLASLSGKEGGDAQKLLQDLMKLQAAVDVLMGGQRVFEAIGKGVEFWSMSRQFGKLARGGAAGRAPSGMAGGLLGGAGTAAVSGLTDVESGLPSSVLESAVSRGPAAADLTAEDLIRGVGGYSVDELTDVPWARRAAAKTIPGGRMGGQGLVPRRRSWFGRMKRRASDWATNFAQEARGLLVDDAGAVASRLARTKPFRRARQYAGLWGRKAKIAAMSGFRRATQAMAGSPITQAAKQFGQEIKGLLVDDSRNLARTLGRTRMGRRLGRWGSSLGSRFRGLRLGTRARWATRGLRRMKSPRWLAGVGSHLTTYTGTAGAGIGAIAGSGAAAAAGVGAALISAVDMFRQIGKHGLMGGAEKGSWTDTIATKEVEALAWFERMANRMGVSISSAAKAMNEGAEMTERLTERLKERREEEARDLQLVAIQTGERRQIAGAEDRARTMRQQWEDVLRPTPDYGAQLQQFDWEASQRDAERRRAIRFREPGAMTEAEADRAALEDRMKRLQLQEEQRQERFAPQRERAQTNLEDAQKRLDEARKRVAAIGDNVKENIRTPEEIAASEARVAELDRQIAGGSRARSRRKKWGLWNLFRGGQDQDGKSLEDLEEARRQETSAAPPSDRRAAWEQERDEAIKDQAEAEKQLHDAALERVKVEKMDRDEARAFFKEKIATAEKAVEQAQKETDAAKERILAERERIGGMHYSQRAELSTLMTQFNEAADKGLSGEQQERFAALKKKFQEEGAEGMTAEERREAQDLDMLRAQAAAENLPEHMLEATGRLTNDATVQDALSRRRREISKPFEQMGIGFRESMAGADQQANAEAAKAEREKAVAERDADERRRATAETEAVGNALGQATEQQLKVLLENPKFKVTLDADVDNTAKQVANQVMFLIREYEQNLKDLVEAEVKKQKTELANKPTQGAGGRVVGQGSNS